MAMTTTANQSPDISYQLSYPVTTVGWNGKLIERESDEAWLPTCRILKELGINHLMLTGYVTLEDAAFDMMEETKRLGGVLDSMGMRPAQHHGLSATYAPIEKPQEPVVERLIRSVQYTANLNSPVLVIHPGHYYDPENWGKVTIFEMFDRECERHGKEKVIQTMVQNLREVVSEAEKNSVKIALENVDRFSPAGDSVDLVEIVKEVDSPYVGFCFDSGHAHCCGLTSVIEWINLAGDKLFTTHFHDNLGPRLEAKTSKRYIPTSGIDEHMPPGFGTIPWIDVIQSLWRIGYKNPVNFESSGWPGMDKKDGFESAIHFWRTCEKLARDKQKSKKA